MAEDQTDQDNSVEAMHAANELMKEAIKASQEIKEKSQETGYQEGFSRGYATGHEEGLKDGTRDGFQVGLREGLNEGMTQATSEIEQKLQEIHELLDAINEERQQALDNREKELLDIVFAIARKVVRTQTEIDTDAVRNAILEAVGHAAEQSRLVVWIHPEDERLVESLRSDFHQRFAQPSAVRMQTDPSLHRGGCRVETIHGRIDATVETQMGKIREALEAVYRLEAGA
jgi:flagellar assembly protein FliH